MTTTSGSKLTPVMTQKKLQTEGISASYMNCVHALERLEFEFFGSDIEQYSFLPSCMTELNRRGHKTNLDVVDGVFKRLCIVFREGIQAYRPYFERGIAMDGTFLKTSIGGALPVVCFRNGNSEIQIVGAGVVSAEDEDN